MYEELIEKLRKNNRMSGWTHIDRLIDEAAEAIEALQQENNQLRAQLDEWKYEVKCHMDEVIAREKQIEQLRVRVARLNTMPCCEDCPCVNYCDGSMIEACMGD